MIVVDTNIIAYLHITGKFTPLAIQLLEKDAHWIAPPLWQNEFRNVLVNYIRHEVLTLKDATNLMEDAFLTMQNRDVPPSHRLVLSLAAKSTSSSYDCEFVALAQETDSKLVTVDKQIIKNFKGIAISLEEFTQ